MRLMNMLAVVGLALVSAACGQSPDLDSEFLMTDKGTENYIVVGSRDTFFKESTRECALEQIQTVQRALLILVFMQIAALKKFSGLVMYDPTILVRFAVMH